MDLSKIKLVATDCDGVLTDGGLYYTESGEEMKRFCVLDGVGFQELQRNGIKTAIITAENNPLIQHRANKLKIDYLIMGTRDKLGALEDLCQKNTIDLNQVAYIGDDIFDLPAIEKCLFGCVPSSANDYIKRKARYVTQKQGGQGCFREISDMILGIIPFNENVVTDRDTQNTF
ncbi:KdsC family phosphatase [Paenibacillus vini]|uniref:3-deoxy-D-manno-octulosonate 8-phosphate phosphatase n=1 Tax=Paenibacillus vini TaxID=1476024 RepID=A0ABQ4MJQ2_9BACL|nr:HAD-IIIA family hydrolase [Paenibacillus vini]GIP55872.1 hypothetical protein J42TS3_49070 [Paenibacillus vini]